MKNEFTIGAFGLITNEKDEILLVHRNDYDLWNLPGGAMESGESPWSAVIREVKEETGFDVEIMGMQGIYSKTGEDDLVFSFSCEIIGGEKTLNEEASAIEFFAIEDIPINTSPKQVERIKDYYEDKASFIMKEQQGKSTVELIEDGEL